MFKKNLDTSKSTLDRKVIILATLFIITTFYRTNRSFLIVKDIYINIQLRRFNAIIIRNNEREKREQKSFSKI